MKAGRNEPCPCGSGKKYKKCCLGKNQAASPAQPTALSLARSASGPPEAVSSRAKTARPAGQAQPHA